MLGSMRSTPPSSSRHSNSWDDNDAVLRAFSTLAALDSGAKSSTLVGLSTMDRFLLERILKHAWTTHPVHGGMVKNNMFWIIFFGEMEQTFRSKGLTQSSRGGGSARQVSAAVDMDGMLQQAQTDLETTEGSTPFQLVNVETNEAVPLILAPMESSDSAFFEQRRKEMKFEYHPKMTVSTLHVWKPAKEQMEDGEWMLVTEEGLMAPFGGKRGDFALLTDAQLKAALKHHHYRSCCKNWFFEEDPGGNLWRNKYDVYGSCQMSVAEIKRDGFPIGLYGDTSPPFTLKTTSKVADSAMGWEPAEKTTSISTVFATNSIKKDLFPPGTGGAVPVIFRDGQSVF
tara:strand:+ start:5074 stop:6096 length:1023 start_codon:yes stop_codon:yes gene_type:complete